MEWTIFGIEIGKLVRIHTFVQYRFLEYPNPTRFLFRAPISRKAVFIHQTFVFLLFDRITVVPKSPFQTNVIWALYQHM